MATQYKWVISAMDTAPSEDGLTDVVKVVHWRYQATDAEYFADVYGKMGCATPSETDFTAYPDLTEAQVIKWLETGLDVVALKVDLDQQIENQKNPPIVNLPLPWAVTE
jgi:hypothetical protein